MKSILLVPILISVSLTSLAMREWDSANDPSALFVSYDNNFQRLPSKGVIRGQLWSDTYWPNQEGRAAWRWQQGKTQGGDSNPYHYSLYSSAQVAKMPEAQLNQLSPAEKYDVLLGRYDYPTVQNEMRRAHPSHPKWFGLCHAVAAVTALYQEPQSQMVSIPLVNGGKRQMIFYSSDIKALLALSVDQTSATYAPYIGQRCHPGAPNSLGCWDSNPASFYIAISNMVGVLKKPLVIDVDRGPEVWNSVVKSYSSVLSRTESISPRAHPETVREVRVDMTVQHTVGASPQKYPVGESLSSTKYSFTLELDSRENIVGGEWISDARPDMIWVPYEGSLTDPNLSFIYRFVQRR